MPVTGDEAVRVATKALVTGAANDALAASQGNVLDAIAISSPDGEADGWFVPIELHGLLRGFVQVDAAGRFRRYGSFAAAGDLRGGSALADWIEPATIRDRAGTLAEPDEQLGTPVLTWDGSPDRLYWRVVAARPDGRRRVLCVTGRSVWISGDPRA